VIVVCSSCGSSNPEGNRFCGQCGAQLPQPETLIVPAGPVSSAFRQEVEKQQYQLRQLQRRAEDKGLSCEPNAASGAGRRATDRKAEAEPATMVDADAPDWGSRDLSDVPAWQSSQRNNFDDETIVGDPNRDSTLHATSHGPFAQETRVIDTRASSHEVAAEREYEEPPISGPSFLGLGRTESEDNNLAYLYEDQPRSGHARYWIAALIVLACAGFFAYQWKQNWNWDTTIIGRHKAQQADAGKPSGETATDAKANAVAPGNGQPNGSGGAVTQDATGAPSAPAVQGDAVAASPSTPPPEDKSASAASSGGAPAQQPAASDKSQTATAEGTAKADVSADQGSTSANEPEKGTARAGTSGATDQNSADAGDQGAAADEADNGGDEVADSAPPRSSKPAEARPAAKRAEAKPATGRYAEKEPGNELVAKAEKYLYGRGVSKNCDQALVYLRTAANRGNADARSKLGALYATGHCVSMDRAEAYNWFTLARDAGSKNVWVERNREMLWSQMTPSEKERTLGP
jgi:hypothetical protein